MAKRELRLFEDPDLQKACRPVTEVSDHVRGLLDDLAETLKTLPGCVSLAANQVGVLRRLAVVKTASGFQKLVNPEIVEQRGAQEVKEDCVCFKDIEGYVLRPRRIVVEALDENGEKVTITAENEDVSLYCHVIDHLDGKILVKEVIRFANDPIEGE